MRGDAWLLELHGGGQRGGAGRVAGALDDDEAARAAAAAAAAIARTGVARGGPIERRCRGPRAAGLAAAGERGRAAGPRLDADRAVRAVVAGDARVPAAATAAAVRGDRSAERHDRR